jgi:tryptophan halogenase
MNHAIAFPTEDVTDLKPYTLSRALSSGWNWRISTQERYGNGYVFCDDFIDSTKAYDEVQSVYKEEVKVAKDIKFEAGRVDQFWINNCVTIGLSSAFVEPLEASSIGHTILQSFAAAQTAVRWFVDRSGVETFNERMVDSFDNIVDFVQLHYITKRDDTPFWKEIQHKMVKTPFIEHNLETYKKSLPRQIDFSGQYLMFNANNWGQVMAGLELYDREHIKQELISRFGKDIIDTNIMRYREFLGATEKQLYIDHKVLLQQNKIFVKFDKM